MPRHEVAPLKRMHIWVYESDYDRLNRFFGNSVGPSKAARRIIHEALNRLEAKVLSAGRHGKIGDEDV